MIQIYKITNSNYEYNGDMTLFPFSCEIDTSKWQLSMIHPIDDEGRWTYIVEEAVIKAPSFNGEQLFRIKKVRKEDSGVEVIAYPIFYDAKDEVFLESVHSTNKTGQQALDIMMEGTKFFGETDITKVNTAYYENKNLLEALQGIENNSFINRWGGEVMYDNFKIIIKERLGEDYGLSIKYGKNVRQNGLNETVDLLEVVTRVYPKAYNGRKLSSKYVDSPLINSYAKKYIKELEFSDIKLAEDVVDGDTDGIICATQDDLDVALINRCNELFTKGLDKPKVTINADLILLENTSAYSSFKNLERVHLGDTVYCSHSKLGIVSTARVVNLVYDCVANKVASVEIGSHKKDYIEKTSGIINTVSQVINTNNKTLLGEKIQGVIDLAKTALKAQKNVAQKQDVRAILFEDLDPNSPTYGATCLGSAGIEFAGKRNETNTDWDWRTAINFQGVLADAVITGLLTDSKGNNSWDLDTGILRTHQMIATLADITGKITATSGEIGGFTLNEHKMTATTTKIYDFTMDDWDIIGTFIYGGVTPTQEQIERYDLNGDGVVDDNDRSAILDIIDSNNKLTTKFTLYPKFTTGANSIPIFELEVEDKSRVWIDKIGQLHSNRAYFDYLYSDGTLLELKFSPMGCTKDGGGATLLWSGSDYAPMFYVGEIEQYKYFLVQLGSASSNHATWVVCPYCPTYISSYFRGIGGYETEGTENGGRIYFVDGSISEGTITIRSAWYRNSTSFTTVASATKMYVKKVVGIR